MDSRRRSSTSSVRFDDPQFSPTGIPKRFKRFRSRRHQVQQKRERQIHGQIRDLTIEERRTDKRSTRKRVTERQRDRETERQRDRETGRQGDRETERQRERDRETDKRRGDREAGRGRQRDSETCNEKKHML